MIDGRIKSNHPLDGYPLGCSNHAHLLAAGKQAFKRTDVTKMTADADAIVEVVKYGGSLLLAYAKIQKKMVKVKASLQLSIPQPHQEQTFRATCQSETKNG